MSVLLEIFHAIQACGAVVAGLFSAMAIYNLNQWEPQTRKASKYSNMAAQQLQKTQRTQASGAAAALSSLVSSVLCVILVSSEKSTALLLLSIASTGGLFLAYSYISNYWNDKAKVPMAQHYNDGTRASQQLLQVLGILTATWLFSSIVYLFRAIVY